MCGHPTRCIQVTPNMQRVASPKRSTVRSRATRERRRRGMRCFMVQLDNAEIKALVKAGYLETPITGPTAVQIAIEAFVSDKLGER